MTIFRHLFGRGRRTVRTCNRQSCIGAGGVFVGRFATCPYCDTPPTRKLIRRYL